MLGTRGRLLSGLADESAWTEHLKDLLLEKTGSADDCAASTSQ